MLLIEKRNLTHSLAIGKKMASMKSPRSGPPTRPKIVMAIWSRVVPRKGARKDSPTVRTPNTTAGMWETERTETAIWKHYANS